MVPIMIFISFRKMSRAREGYYEISYNIPTTKAEIMDFTRLAGERERRLGSRTAKVFSQNALDEKK